MGFEAFNMLSLLRIKSTSVSRGPSISETPLIPLNPVSKSSPGWYYGVSKQFVGGLEYSAGYNVNGLWTWGVSIMSFY